MPDEFTATAGRPAGGRAAPGMNPRKTLPWLMVVLLVFIALSALIVTISKSHTRRAGHA